MGNDVLHALAEPLEVAHEGVVSQLDDDTRAVLKEEEECSGGVVEATGGRVCITWRSCVCSRAHTGRCDEATCVCVCVCFDVSNRRKRSREKRKRPG